MAPAATEISITNTRSATITGILILVLFGMALTESQTRMLYNPNLSQLARNAITASSDVSRRVYI